MATYEIPDEFYETLVTVLNALYERKDSKTGQRIYNINNLHLTEYQHVGLQLFKDNLNDYDPMCDACIWNTHKCNGPCKGTRLTHAESMCKTDARIFGVRQRRL